MKKKNSYTALYTVYMYCPDVLCIYSVLIVFKHEYMNILTVEVHNIKTKSLNRYHHRRIESRVL